MNANPPQSSSQQQPPEQNNQTQQPSASPSLTQQPSSSSQCHRHNSGFAPISSSPSQEMGRIFLRGGAAGGRGTKRRASSALPPSRRPQQPTGTQTTPVKREFTTKEIILLPSSNQDTIVRGSRKQELMAGGFCLSEVTMNKDWTEKECEEFLESIFSSKLENLPSSSSRSK